MRFIAIAAAVLLQAAGLQAGEEPGGHRYRLINDAGQAEGRPALDLAGTKIVFYGEPGAAFSIQALADLSKDDTAKTALLSRAFFITGAESLPAAAEWNRTSPFEYTVMYSTGDWPKLVFSAEPRIFFYSDESALCDLKGWRGAESSAEFRACLEKAGLLAVPARLESALAVSRLARGEDDLDDERKRLVCSEFKTLLKAGAFAAARLQAYDSGTLKNAYDLTSYSNFYTPGEESLAAQGELLAELGKRGLANEDKVQDLYQRLLNSKLFPRAAALKAVHPAYELQTVPPITGSLKTKPGEAAVYFTSDGRSALEIKKLKKSGRRILVAAFPGCHFADQALEAIDKDAELGPIFRKYALPLTSRVDFASLGSWNTAHKLQYRMTVSNGDWPGIDFTSSPIFYFIKNGKILHEAPGWADEDPFSRIYEGLSKLFPEMKFRNKPENKKAKSAKSAKRRRLPRYALGKYLKGLNDAQVNRFCSSLRFEGGVFSGAYMDDIRENLGEKREEELYGYFTSKTGAMGSSPGTGGVTLGELWKGLDAEHLNRTCVTIIFNRGRFGGLNFGDLTDTFGEKAYNEVFSYFSPPENKTSGKGTPGQ